MQKQVYILEVSSSPIQQAIDVVTFSYQWGIQVTLVVTAAIMAISILAWMIHR